MLHKYSNVVYNKFFSLYANFVYKKMFGGNKIGKILQVKRKWDKCKDGSYGWHYNVFYSSVHNFCKP